MTFIKQSFFRISPVKYFLPGMFSVCPGFSSSSIILSIVFEFAPTTSILPSISRKYLPVQNPPSKKIPPVEQRGKRFVRAESFLKAGHSDIQDRVVRAENAFSYSTLIGICVFLQAHFVFLVKALQSVMRQPVPVLNTRPAETATLSFGERRAVCHVRYFPRMPWGDKRGPAKRVMTRIISTHCLLALPKKNRRRTGFLFVVISGCQSSISASPN